MKTRILTFPIVALLAAACGSKGGNTEADSASASSSDSIQVETTATLPDSIAGDTIAAYLSDDLKKFGLHGKVKSVKTKEYSSFVSCLSGPLAFNEEGVLTSNFSDYTDNEISYDPDGFIDETECRESDGTTFELEFTNFDTEGNPVSGKYKSEGPEEIWEVTFTITYLEFDKENNWTKRTFKGDSTSRTMNDSGDYGRPQTEPFTATESRTIIYYSNY